jgi:hypothetical protein
VTADYKGSPEARASQSPAYVRNERRHDLRPHRDGPGERARNLGQTVGKQWRYQAFNAPDGQVAGRALAELTGCYQICPNGEVRAMGLGRSDR